MTERPVIVVGVDGSPESASAVAWAAREAASRGSALRIVHAWHSHPFIGSPFYINAIPELVNEPEHAANADLDNARDLALSQDPGLDVETLMPGGPSAMTLLGKATDAQMLVIGGKHRSALDRAVFGSVTTHAVTHAHCPVVVVRAQPDSDEPRRRRVVLGFDRSEPSRLAADFAFEFAHRNQLDVAVVDACHLPPGVDTGSHALLELYRETFADAISFVSHRYPDLAVVPIVEYGHPSVVLLAQAADAELLVVGSRGLGHFEGMLLGSVSASLVHQSPITLAVVR